MQLRARLPTFLQLRIVRLQSEMQRSHLILGAYSPDLAWAYYLLIHTPSLEIASPVPLMKWVNLLTPVKMHWPQLPWRNPILYVTITNSTFQTFPTTIHTVWKRPNCRPALASPSMNFVGKDLLQLILAILATSTCK